MKESEVSYFTHALSWLLSCAGARAMETTTASLYLPGTKEISNFSTLSGF
jgi:hypothetical protein